jgi:hypothetical protein
MNPVPEFAIGDVVIIKPNTELTDLLHRHYKEPLTIRTIWYPLDRKTVAYGFCGYFDNTITEQWITLEPTYKFLKGIDKDKKTS